MTAFIVAIGDSRTSRSVVKQKPRAMVEEEGEPQGKGNRKGCAASLIYTGKELRSTWLPKSHIEARYCTKTTILVHSVV